MKKTMKKFVALAVALTTALSSCVTAFAGTTNFILDTDGEMIPIPETYTVSKSIKNLGDYGILSNAEDLFYDSLGYLYVADTGNNRVLKMTTSGEVLLEITSGMGTDLNSPRGVFVDDEGQIWIADTGNLRIVVLDKNGNDVREMGKPESDVLGDDFTFDIEKICINNMGYVFALKGANIMKINSKNEFLSYMGTPDVGFSFTRFLIRKFGSLEQRERTERVEPTAYNNFTIGADGNMYGVLASGTSGQIRRLNSVGENTYPENSFGFNIYKQGELTPTEPTFNDIAVDSNGIITTVDQWTGLIYQYDTEGNLLTTFGGIGNRSGMFTRPNSIVVDKAGNLYVLDWSANNIQVFEPTAFIEQVHDAIVLQAAGNYEDAKSYWEAVLDIDSNYSLAHKCIGKILYKEGDYTESKRQYELAEDKEGYSTSFSEERHEFIRDFFFLIVAVVVVLLVIIGKLFVTVKRRADKWAFNIEMRGDMDR